MRKIALVTMTTLGALALSQPVLAQSSRSTSNPGAQNSDPAMSTMPGREGSGANAGPNPTIPNSAGSGNASGVPSTGGFGSGGNSLPDSRGAVRGPAGENVNCPPGSSIAQCGPTQPR